MVGDQYDAAAHRVSAWLTTLRLGFTDVAWVSWMQFQFASELVARRLNADSAARVEEARTRSHICANALFAYIEHRTKLRVSIVEAADNPALLMLFRALDRTWREIVLPYDGAVEIERQGVAATRRVDQKLIEAVISRKESYARVTARRLAKEEYDRIGERVALGLAADRKLSPPMLD